MPLLLPFLATLAPWRSAPRQVLAGVRAVALALCLMLVAISAAGAQDWGYLEDETASLTVTDVAGREFAPTGTHFAKGFTRAAHWIRLDMPDADGPMLLRMELPILDDLRLYTQDATGAWHEARSGDRVPYAARPWQSPFMGFVLSEQDLERPVFVRVASSGTNAVTLILMPLAEGVAAQHRLMLVHMAVFGLQLMAIAVCLLLYLPSRDGIFLWFALAQLTWLVSGFVFNGYASVLFPQQTTDIAYSAMGTASFLVEIMFHLLVIRRFAPAPGLMRVATVLVGASIVIVPVLWMVDVSLALQVRSAATVVFIILMVALAATARNADLMPLALLRVIYWAYLGLVMLWMIPLVGLTDATWVARHAIILHGTANLALIFVIVLRMGMIRHRQGQRAREALAKAEMDRQVSARTIETQNSLIRMLSHEVGTALSVIRYSVEKEPLSDRNRKRIAMAVSGLDQSVQSLVDADRIVGGEMAVHIRPTDPACVMRDIVTDQADDRVRLTVEDAAQGATVRTDPDLLRVILRHLLDNACKYAADGGGIAVRITAGPEAGAVTFTFRNPLRGGPAPDLAKLGTRYYRDPHVLALPGTGVGLSVVAEVAKRLGAEFALSLDGADFIAKLKVG